MKKNKLPSLVAILILTLITSVMWISFSVYRALTTETPLKISKTILEPLNPSLDEETIGQIESKIFLNESQIPETSYLPLNRKPLKYHHPPRHPHLPRPLRPARNQHPNMINKICHKLHL